MRYPKNKTRGFSLLEAMVAGAIFIVGITSVTALVLMSSRQRGIASKGVSMSRIITEEHLNLERLGYDGLLGIATATVTGDVTPANVPGWSATKMDENGRTIGLTGNVTRTCGSPPSIPAATQPAPPSSPKVPEVDAFPCCVNTDRFCCLRVALQAQWNDTSRPGSPPIQERYTGFVTKGCPSP